MSKKILFSSLILILTLVVFVLFLRKTPALDSQKLEQREAPASAISQTTQQEKEPVLLSNDKVYTHPQGDYSFKYPEGWKTETYNETPGNDMHAANERGGEAQSASLSDSTGNSIDIYYRYGMLESENGVAFGSETPKSTKNTIVDGLLAKEFSYEDSGKVVKETVVVQSNSTIFFISWSANESASVQQITELRTVFNEVTKSLTFKK